MRRVLVIEPVETLRILFQRILKDCVVTTVPNQKEARLKLALDEYDIVTVNLGPSYDPADEFIKKAREMRPDIKIMYVTEVTIARAATRSEGYVDKQHLLDNLPVVIDALLNS